jgi:hypothetical protein
VLANPGFRALSTCGTRCPRSLRQPLEDSDHEDSLSRAGHEPSIGLDSNLPEGSHRGAVDLLWNGCGTCVGPQGTDDCRFVRHEAAPPARVPITKGQGAGHRPVEANDGWQPASDTGQRTDRMTLAAPGRIGTGSFIRGF